MAFDGISHQLATTINLVAVVSVNELTQNARF